MRSRRDPPLLGCLLPLPLGGCAGVLLWLLLALFVMVLCSGLGGAG